MQDSHVPERVEFTAEMRKTYTILVPNFIPIHMRILVNLLNASGYHCELLTTTGPQIATEGLKYVHNDTCYPALLTTGQMIDALNSGKYDVNRTALAMTQTGGGCRASNYIHLIRKALRKAGYPQVPVISVNMSGLEHNSGFKLTLSLIRKIALALAYGDLLMLLKNQVRPYETENGAAERLCEQWEQKLSDMIGAGIGFSLSEIRKNADDITRDFAAVPVKRTPKVKVGIVGEIYVKFSPLGNNNLEDFLASQDCEYMLPGVLGFALFKIDNRLEDIKLYGGSAIKKKAVGALFDFVEKIEDALIETVEKYPQFVAPSPYREVKKGVEGMIGYGSKMGEGWLLPAEMVELTKLGYGNIVCTQPFGCLPNHICGKGMIRRIRDAYPDSNIVPIDYDPGATRVNQENRIKLMLAVAAERLAPAAEEVGEAETAAALS